MAAPIPVSPESGRAEAQAEELRAAKRELWTSRKSRRRWEDFLWVVGGALVVGKLVSAIGIAIGVALLPDSNLAGLPGVVLGWPLGLGLGAWLGLAYGPRIRRRRERRA